MNIPIQVLINLETQEVKIGNYLMRLILEIYGSLNLFRGK